MSSWRASDERISRPRTSAARSGGRPRSAASDRARSRDARFLGGVVDRRARHLFRPPDGGGDCVPARPGVEDFLIHLFEGGAQRVKVHRTMVGARQTPPRGRRSVPDHRLGRRCADRRNCRVASPAPAPGPFLTGGSSAIASDPARIPNYDRPRSRGGLGGALTRAVGRGGGRSRRSWGSPSPRLRGTPPRPCRGRAGC